MKRQLGIIFDMDGVLVDSEDAMKTTSIASLERFGIKPEKDDFIEFTGMGEDSFIGGVARKYGLEYKTEMKDYAYMLYIERARELVYVYPGVKDVIRGMKSLGLKTAVASAADLIKVRSNLACIGISEDFFDTFVTGSDVTHKKPDPEIFLKAAEGLGLDPSDCIVIEDSKSGISAAKAAGMTCIAVTTAFSRDELASTDADHIIDDITQSPAVVREWANDRQQYPDFEN